jgi:hypothetical protein
MPDKEPFVPTQTDTARTNGLLPAFGNVSTLSRNKLKQWQQQKLQ